MELQEMIERLVDMGYARSYAETQAPLDFEELDHPTEPKSYECSVCCGSFTATQWRYHYHPCE